MTCDVTLVNDSGPGRESGIIVRAFSRNPNKTDAENEDACIEHAKQVYRAAHGGAEPADVRVVHVGD